MKTKGTSGKTSTEKALEKFNSLEQCINKKTFKLYYHRLNRIDF
jgi:hypothetical protein